MKVTILYDHPDLLPEAFYGTIRLFHVMNKTQESKNQLIELQKLYPDNEFTARAQQLLSAPEQIMDASW